MEEYDVLGNFKDLKNVFKNIPTAAPLQKPSPELERSLEDSLLLEFELSSPKKKKPSVKSDQTKSGTLDKKPTAPKTEELPAVSSNCLAQKEGVAYRTRRSLRSGDESQNNSYAESQSNEINKSVKSGKKSVRSRAKKTNTNTAPAASGPLNTAVAAMSRNNPKKSTRGRGRKNNTSASSASHTLTALNTIEIEDTETFSSARRGLAEPEQRNVMRARRCMMAERAARCPTVDVVDLVSSPNIRVEGFIDLDADDTNNSVSKKSTSNQQPLDASFDEDNPELTVKINWECKPEIFKLRKYQKFKSIFEQLAKRENKTVNEIFLNLNSQIIKLDDTPDTINYKTYQFIDARAMNSSEFCAVAIPKKKRDPNIIKLKVQSDKFKKPLHIELNKTENFRKLVIKCAEELKVPYENIIKLSFDGETLDYHQTPVDLELEGGEIIEIHLRA